MFRVLHSCNFSCSMMEDEANKTFLRQRLDILSLRSLITSVIAEVMCYPFAGTLCSYCFNCLCHSKLQHAPSGRLVGSFLNPLPPTASWGAIWRCDWSIVWRKKAGLSFSLALFFLLLNRLFLLLEWDLTTRMNQLLPTFRPPSLCVAASLGFAFYNLKRLSNIPSALVSHCI